MQPSQNYTKKSAYFTFKTKKSTLIKYCCILGNTMLIFLFKNEFICICNAFLAFYNKGLKEKSAECANFYAINRHNN